VSLNVILQIFKITAICRLGFQKKIQSVDEVPSGSERRAVEFRCNSLNGCREMVFLFFSQLKF